jgi:PAS domain S-box-containing protein
MNPDMFAQQLKTLQGRLVEMYRGASTSVQEQPHLLLPVAFKELGVASEQLQVAAEALLQQSEEIATTRSQVEAERQRYKELFEFMPNPYLVTNPQGKIQEANRATATLLNVDQSYLMGKVLINFIPVQERGAFRSKLNQLHERDRVQEWTLRLQPRNGQLLDIAVSVSVDRDCEGKPVTLRWIVCDITERKRLLKALDTHDYDFIQQRNLHFYSKGEIIPLEPSCLWLVSQGLVKLSTMSETGEEVLIGLAGPSMPFGSSMTSLLTYQATALTKEVHLVSIPLSELAASPRLCQALLPQINQRLRQTESLLAISGKRQVQERLYHLLLLLKREIGQPVAQGTCLGVRLTHQDLADACCTTRVTITRLLGKLQQQGMITWDSNHHIILLKEEYQQKCG